MTTLAQRIRPLLWSLIPALLASIPAADAGSNAWTGIGPDGGWVTEAEFHPTVPGTVYALGLSGFYRSTDDGLNWQLTQQSLGADAFDIAVGPANPDRVLLAATSRVIISNDRGGTFAPLQSSPNTTWRVQYSRDGNTAYFAGGVQIYRSVDGGTTFTARTPLPTTGEVNAIDIDPSNPAIVYVSTFANGIYVSQDGGGTWLLATVPQQFFVQKFIVDPNHPQRLLVVGNFGLFISNDGGLTWPLHPLSEGYGDIDVDPANSNVIYATATDGRIFKSTDGGVQFANLSRVRAGVTLPQLSISPFASSTLMITMADGIARSSDGGATWEVRKKGLTVGTVGAIAAGRNQFYVGANNGGLFTLGVASRSTVELDNTNLLSVSPASLITMNLTAVAGTTEDTLYAVPSQESVARSTDSGRTWTEVFRRSATNPIFVTVSPAEPHTVYTGTHSGLFKSTDDGTTWAERNTGLPAPIEVHGLAIASNPAVLYVATFITTQGHPAPYQIFRSTDGAATWTAVGAPSADGYFALAIHPQNDQILFAGRGSNLYRSTDGGLTWSVRNLPTGDALCCTFVRIAFDPANSKIVYAVAAGVVARSVDGGDSWQVLGSGVSVDPPSSGPVLFAIAIDPAVDGWITVGSTGWGLRQFQVEPDLEIVAAAPASLTLNTAATYTISVRNRGPFDATNARVTLTLPTASTSISASGTGAACTTAQTTVTCTYDVMRVTTTPTQLTLTTTPTATGDYMVRADLVAAEGDPSTANNLSSPIVAVQAQAAPPPAPPSSGGGGGGGALSFELLLILSALRYATSRRRLLRSCA